MVIHGGLFFVFGVFNVPVVAMNRRFTINQCRQQRKYVNSKNCDCCYGNAPSQLQQRIFFFFENINGHICMLYVFDI